MSRIVLALLIASLSPPARAAADLRTVAEISGWARTGRYDETVRLVRAFEQAYPGRVRSIEVGTTPEGRALVGLVASDDGVLSADEARRKRRPVVLFQGGIHAGEIDGKDAGFLALREMLEGTAAPGALRAVTAVFVPIFNVDGHERFGKNNRPNQVGPEEMGWRTTAQNLNLNRDYVKADAPEMQAMLRLLHEWDPIAYVDLHVTDGAHFQHDVAVLVDPSLAGPPNMAALGQALEDELMLRLTRQGHLPLGFYPSFVDDDDPSSGFEHGVMPPRLSNGYWSLFGRFGILVETHSWKDYATRVRGTRNLLVSLFEITARDGRSWLEAAAAVDAQAGRGPMALTYRKTGELRVIDFLGYSYVREPSAISGGLVTRYDTTRPETWKVPLADRVAPDLVVTPSFAGYLVPPAHSWVLDKLRLHGVEVTTLPVVAGPRDVEVFRATEVKLATRTFEGRTQLMLKGEWTRERREVPPGTLFVPAAQAHALIAHHLLDPRGPDSLAAWGSFNAHFERKEYMEAYVAEAEAVRMLRDDSKLAAEFARRLAKDDAFRADPSARLDFFYRRHPAWDERYELYPVFRWLSE